MFCAEDLGTEMEKVKRERADSQSQGRSGKEAMPWTVGGADDAASSDAEDIEEEEEEEELEI